MSPFEDRFTGDVPGNALKITGLAVDGGGLTTPAALPGKVWLNIGDSIMSGDGAAYAQGQGRPPDDAWAASEDGRASYLVDFGKVTFATCDGQHPTTAGHEAICKAALPVLDAIVGKAEKQVGEEAECGGHLYGAVTALRGWDP